MSGRTGWVAIDGELVAPERATVSVFDRGFLYGDAVFETIRCYGARAFEAARHLDRLRKSADEIGLTPPLDGAAQLAELERLYQEVHEQSPAGDHTIRLMWTRGEGDFSLLPRGVGHARRVMFIRPLVAPPRSAYQHGVSAICHPTYRPSDAAAGAKVANYIESIIALRRAEAVGAHEALIVCHDGHVIEGTTSNVFAVLGGVVCTPPTTESLLPGITRAHCIDAATALGMTISERRLTPEDLAAAGEVFVTSTVRELLPVVELDGHRIGDGEVGPACRAIHAEFRRRCGLPGPLPWEP